MTCPLCDKPMQGGPCCDACHRGLSSVDRFQLAKGRIERDLLPNLPLETRRLVEVALLSAHDAIHKAARDDRTISRVLAREINEVARLRAALSAVQADLASIDEHARADELRNGIDVARETARAALELPKEASR